jgi:hypothetical protein
MGMFFNLEDETLNNNILLNELAIASTNRIGIHVESEHGRNIGLDPKTSMAYFKVSKASGGYTKSNSITRISIFRPEYVDHYVGAGRIRLTSKERNDLVSILKATPTAKQLNGINIDRVIEKPTVWHVLLYNYNVFNFTDNERIILNNSIRKPNGISIPLDTPMPEYGKLEVSRR